MIRQWTERSRALTAALRPWLDLLIRVCLAQAFLAMQVHTMMARGAVDAWALAAGIAPLLLTIGLLTRPAAGVMLAQTAMIAGGDIRLFWAALLLRLFVIGPGALSVDRLLQHGAESVAMPGAAALVRAGGWLRRVVGPLYQLGLRLWIAAAPAGVALAALGVTTAMRPGGDLVPGLPSMIAHLPVALAVLAAAMLALGAGTQIAARVLLILVPISQLGTGDERLYWALLLACLVIYGPGSLSVDAWLSRRMTRRAPPLDRAALPHVVVVGGGFGGVAAVQGLRRAACRITLIDRRNYHLFQPLLYQVATASLSPADIATPVRELFRTQDNVRVLLGEVTGVDTAARTVLLDRGAIAYDHLILATGAQHSYFGRDDWAPFAPGLKSIEDGTAIRRRLLLAFEEAEAASDPATRAAWLTFVIVGGGPTGVELAGAIAELARHGFEQEFRRIDPAAARVILVQSAFRLLPAFPEALSGEADRALRHLGVEIQLGRKVEAVDASSVTVSGEPLPTRTVLWAAGVMASPAAAWLGVKPDPAGRVIAGPDLGVPGLAGVYVVGDTASSIAWAGKGVPGLAPAAKQGGAYVAGVIRARLAGRPAPRPFRYRHFGSLATIGRQSAVADFGFVRFRGPLAWWLWGAAHIAFLVGGRNRVVVMLQWLWAYLTFRRGTRLITGA